jgi:hypothetical protein
MGRLLGRSRRGSLRKGPWEEEGDADNMWIKMATCIRKVASGEFGVSRRCRRGAKDTW